MRTARSFAVLLTLPLLVACDKSVPVAAPNEQASQAGQPSPAADGGKDAATGPAREALCDGSDALRLAFVVDGGFVEETFGFTNPHGHAFLAVDGKCRYYAGQNYMRGSVSGTFTPVEAEQLTADLHYDDLDSWAYYGLGKDAACPDSGNIGLMKAKAAAGCSCGCDPTAPSGLGDALNKAYEWVEKLASTGKPLDGPVSAIVLALTLGKGPKQPDLAWPLSRPIESIPNLLVDAGDSKLWMGTGPWAKFDDAADYAKLREMRNATADSDTPGSGYVSQAVLIHAGAMQYSLFVRDELPAAVEQAWKDMKATLPN